MDPADAERQGAEVQKWVAAVVAAPDISARLGPDVAAAFAERLSSQPLGAEEAARNVTARLVWERACAEQLSDEVLFVWNFTRQLLGGR